MLNLLRLARLLANPDLEQKAAQIGSAFIESVQQSPLDFTQLMTAIDFAIGPSYEIVIVGNPIADDTREMLQTIYRRFIPNKVIIFFPPETSTDIRSVIPFTSRMSSIEDKATAYVCQNYSCKLPATT